MRPVRSVTIAYSDVRKAMWYRTHLRMAAPSSASAGSRVAMRPVRSSNATRLERRDCKRFVGG